MSVFFVPADGDGEVDPIAPTPGATGTQTQSEAHQALATFWDKVTEEIRKIGVMDLKTQSLPLARIKKIMKLDDDVKMISAEAPMLFAKAAEIFIHELTLRAWIHTEDNKRRTLQRNDIAMAITKYDQFDFLIDIVPRDELKPNKSRDDPSLRTSMNPDQVHYYFQLAQQHQQALQQTATQTGTNSQSSGVSTIQLVQPSQVQTLNVANANVEQVTATASSTTVAQQQASAQQQPQVIQLQQSNQVSASPPAGGIQIVQQIVTPTGEIQQIPIQLTQQQLQMIRMQMQSGTNQPIIIQTAPIQAIQQTSQPQIIQVAPQSGSATPVYLTQATANGNVETE